MSSEENSHSKSPLDYTWRDTEVLKKYVTDTGRILPRRITKLTRKQQGHVTRIIKQARNMLHML